MPSPHNKGKSHHNKCNSHNNCKQNNIQDISHSLENLADQLKEIINCHPPNEKKIPLHELLYFVQNEYPSYQIYLEGLNNYCNNGCNYPCNPCHNVIIFYKNYLCNNNNILIIDYVIIDGKKLYVYYNNNNCSCSSPLFIFKEVNCCCN